MLPCVDEWKVQPSSADAQRQLQNSVESKAAAVLRLKVGAQVMLLKNMSEHGLVNGSRGVVQGFASGHNVHRGVSIAADTMPVVRFDNGTIITLSHSDVFHGKSDGCLVRWQCPLKLAWAITVHKAQGMTISRASMRVDDAFAEGQVYVALSRVSSLDGLYLTGPMLRASAIKAHPDVLAYHKSEL